MSDREIMDAKNGIERKTIGFRDPVVKHVVISLFNDQILVMINTVEH